MMNRNRTKPLGPLSLKVLGAIILASFVFLACFPIKRDDTFPISPVTLAASMNTDTTTTTTGDNGQQKVMPFTLTSPAFTYGQAIPPLFARKTNNANGIKDNDVSPTLTWSNIPQGTTSLVLIMDDPDAPNPKAPRSTPWVHWVVYNIPPTTNNLATGVGDATSPNLLPPGTIQGLNDWQQIGYGGMSPPIGTHRYFFKLYALDIVLSNVEFIKQQQHDNNTTTPAAAAAAAVQQQQHATKAMVIQAMQGHVLVQAELMGTYNKQQQQQQQP